MQSTSTYSEIFYQHGLILSRAIGWGRIDFISLEQQISKAWFTRILVAVESMLEVLYFECLVSCRGAWCHLTEWGWKSMVCVLPGNCHWIMFIHEFNRPKTPQELYDLWHTSPQNVVEHIFLCLKKALGHPCLATPIQHVSSGKGSTWPCSDLQLYYGCWSYWHSRMFHVIGHWSFTMVIIFM